VTFPAFKAGDSALRGSNGGFDFHTPPPMTRKAQTRRADPPFARNKSAKGRPPADERFSAAVRTAIVPTGSLARYYLRKLQIAADGKDEPEYTPNADKDVTLEHILPQKPGNEWKMPTELMQSLYNRLGNQALLVGSVNWKLGNVGFETKRKALADSKYSLTSQVSVSPKWEEQEIAARQDVLANLAKKAWPFMV
jgi:hypothetical protein